MRTRKTIATISYNTEEFLRKKLEKLCEQQLICDFMYIPHKKESDEAKNHIHLWIKPNTMLDTMDLQKILSEQDPSGNKKPLKCIDFKYSDIDEWILYDQHYAPYLASKGESREYHYKKEDFRYYDEDTFEDNYMHAFRGSKWAERNQLLQQLNDGRVKFSDLIRSGQVPLMQAPALNAYKFMLQADKKLDRNGRPNHEEEYEDDELQARKNVTDFQRAREIRKRKEEKQKQLELETKEGGFMEIPEEDPFAEGSDFGTP